MSIVGDAARLQLAFELARIFGEGLGAVRAAEVDLLPLVVNRELGLDRLAAHRAGGLLGEAFVEIGEDQRELLLTLGTLYFGLAVGAAEGDLHALHINRRIGLDRSAGERAGNLRNLPCAGKLMLRLVGELFWVGGKRLGAVRAAEEDLLPFVSNGVFRLGRGARDGTLAIFRFIRCFVRRNQALRHRNCQCHEQCRDQSIFHDVGLQCAK